MERVTGGEELVPEAFWALAGCLPALHEEVGVCPMAHVVTACSEAQQTAREYL